MVGDKDLLGQQSETAKSSRVNKWYMVTNHLNLFYMLASGLLMPPAGFDKKYYQDTLACFPGWLPVFPEQVPKAAIEFSVREADHLIPCVLEIGLGSFRGSAKVVGFNSNVMDINFPEDVAGDKAFVLLPAPLPVTWITEVILETREKKISCEKNASDFYNVDFSDVSLKPLKRVFNKATNTPWPPHVAAIHERKVSLARPCTAGGVLAMLAQLGNTGDVAIGAAKLAFDQGAPEESMKNYRIITAASDWLDLRELGENHGESAKLYWRLLDRLVAAAEQKVGGAPPDVILGALKEASTDSNLSENFRAGIKKLIEALRECVKLSKYTANELLEQHTGLLSRSLLLFFLKENCSEFLAFRHDLLNEYNYILSAILLGATKKWLGLPTSLKEMPGLKAACCHRMALMSHEIDKSAVELGPSPARPESLQELLCDEPWKRNQKEAALMLARKCKWDCIHTRVSLGKGEYKLKLDGHGAQFVLNGEPKFVQITADRKAVLRHLKEGPIPWEVENAARSLLDDKSA